MALTVTPGSPIHVTGTTNAKEEILDALVFVKFIYWYCPSTAGHKAAIQDRHGKIIGKFYCEEDTQSEILPICQLCDGLFSDDLDSGELLIYPR